MTYMHGYIESIIIVQYYSNDHTSQMRIMWRGSRRQVPVLFRTGEEEEAQQGYRCRSPIVLDKGEHGEDARRRGSGRARANEDVLSTTYAHTC